MPFLLVSKHRVGCAAAAALVALAGTATAQIKTDGAWRGAVGAAASFTSGNNRSSTVGVTTDFARATLLDRVSINGALNYGRSRVEGVDRTTQQKWVANGQYDVNLSPANFVFAKQSLEGDRIAHLDLRSTTALGVGHKLVDEPNALFSLFGGAGYTRDRYSQPETVDGRTGTRFSRTSLLLGEETSHNLTATTSLKQRLEFYPGVSGDQAKLVKFNANLAVAITQTLNLTVGFNGVYNSKPPAGQQRSDTALFTGLNIKFGAW